MFKSLNDFSEVTSYWIKSRETSTRSTSIIRPPIVFRHPYPQSKVEASDKAEGDKGNNFGRIARAGLLDDYLNKIKMIDVLRVDVSLDFIQ